MKHHEYGPSNFPAWSMCPCYRRAESTSKESEAGTDAHQQLHDALVNGTTPDNDAAAWAASWVMAQNPINLKSEVEVKSHCDAMGDIFGTVDVMYEDESGVLHITDFKTFSDGTIDYMPQLRAYAALLHEHEDKPVVLHVLHGMTKNVETIETSFGTCLEATEEILKSIKSDGASPRLCKWCQYCSKIQTCQQSNNAVQVVSDNAVAFSRLSLCQKLVVLDTVDKLSKTIREEAKAKAVENGGFLDMDGIRYEMKPWAGPSKCRDIGEVAGAMDNLWVDKSSRKGDSCSIHAKGLTNEKLLATCTLSKTALVAAMKDANPDAKLTKADWERWADKFFEKTDGTPHFVRVM